MRLRLLRAGIPVKYTHEQIAGVCYEANRALQDVLNDAHVPPPWQVMTPAEREPYVAGVRFALSPGPWWRRLLAAIAGRSGPVWRTPREQHDQWMAYKLADGWSYGAKVDELARTHPCLLPYDQVPDTQKAKDKLFQAIVAALAGE